MNGVKVTKTVVGAIQVGQSLRPVCSTEGVCLQHVSVQAQQCSSSAGVQQIRALCPRCHHAWASEGTPVGLGKDTHTTMAPK